MAKRLTNLFDAQREATLRNQSPLATRMRPETLDEFVGQEHILGEGRLLRRAILDDHLFSMILWGPPGSGKTTLARLIARITSADFEQVSAVSAGVADLRKVITQAQDRLGMFQTRTVLFIDEIHRFNKAQQDAILPYVEDGTVILIGATTENPSFDKFNNALLSRTRVFTLEALTDEQIGILVDRALTTPERGLAALHVVLASDARSGLLRLTNGDARMALNALEVAALSKTPSLGDKRLITLEDIRDALQSRSAYYDRRGDLHYDAISALHKSVRDSDPDAALYWLGRMLDGGEDPLYVARRVVRMAVEDIGLADPQALPLTIAAQQAMAFMGQPEADLALAEAIVYLCQAPKSNSIYRAYKAALHDVKQTRQEPVPLHLRNAPTSLMRDLGSGKGYEYAHDLPNKRSDQAHLPPSLEGRIYYEPTDQGFEATITQRFAWRLERPPQALAATAEQQQSTSDPQPDQSADAPSHHPDGSASEHAQSLDPQSLAGEESQEVIEAAPAPRTRKKRRTT
ncbi:MAG: replication-associated recombination protein A [Chloroflexaceae bacterium]|nr:replication-associated recombination protein A [Chloroflexaceae bacterium]